MDKRVNIQQLMRSSGVKFGTSGARGLVTDMTDEVCYAYTAGFIQYLEETGELHGQGRIAYGGDLRSSTGRIMSAVAKAIMDRGYEPENCGRLPSPALARHGLAEKIPTAMVTGSHIPDDRNGIKYTKKAGEILKADEAGMKSQTVAISEGLFDSHGAFKTRIPESAYNPSGRDRYVRRYLDFFPSACLAGKKIGVFQHSAVGRELMVEILEGLGAEVVTLGFSDEFIPVDTEAIRPQDIDNAREWSSEYGFDSIVSTDGDSDRPLTSDENGKWLRGDVAGILCAAQLDADAVVTPVSCNTAVEKSGLFKRVERTRIGSPYVIERMQEIEREGARPVVGYEANGGFLIQSPIESGGKTLSPLPTRDAVIVHLAILMRSIEQKKPISELFNDLPRRYTYSDRLKEFPTDKSKARIAELYSGDEEKDTRVIESVLGQYFGKVKSIDATDGIRVTFENDEIVHLRPSGNAPEFRCYTEADSEARAREINKICTGIMSTWRQ